MPVEILVKGENGLDAATQLRNFVVGLQLGNALPTDEQAKAGTVSAKKPANDDADKPAPKKAAKPAPVDDDEDEAPAPKKKAAAKKAPVNDDDDEDDKPAPKKKAAKPAPAEDDDEEEEAPASKKKKSADGESSVGELVDDGEDQEATVDGCRIMIRRVARAKGAGTDHAQAILAEFGVAGATKVPEKKMQKFIDRCQAVIEDPESIELE